MICYRLASTVCIALTLLLASDSYGCWWTWCHYYHHGYSQSAARSTVVTGGGGDGVIRVEKKEPKKEDGTTPTAESGSRKQDEELKKLRLAIENLQFSNSMALLNSGRIDAEIKALQANQRLLENRFEETSTKLNDLDDYVRKEKGGLREDIRADMRELLIEAKLIPE